MGGLQIMGGLGLGSPVDRVGWTEAPCGGGDATIIDLSVVLAPLEFFAKVLRPLTLFSLHKMGGVGGWCLVGNPHTHVANSQ